jgi:hypothetical protein
MSAFIYLYKPVSLVSMCTVPSSSSHSLLSFPSSSLPFRNIYHQSYSLHSIYSTSENPSVTSSEMTAMMLRSTLTEKYVYISWFINLLGPMKIHSFLHRWCYGFKYMCSGFLFLVCGLISLTSWLFSCFLFCGLVQVLFLSLVVNFYYLNSHILVTILGLDLFTDTYINKAPFLWCPADENNII